MKKIMLTLSIVLVTTVIVLTASTTITGNSINNPDKIISNLEKAIDIAKEKGDYNCCIEPDCTMCYLGHWIFDKGTCHCDEAIAEGRTEDVCPECKKGIEKGQCSSKESECLLDPSIFGGQ